MPKIRPTGITADRSRRTVTIEWSDGHTSEYTFAGLRIACPCVECKGGHAYMGELPDPRLVRDAQAPHLDLEDIRQVGGYALQFFWSDRHATGIYTWELLRSICPCPECVFEHGTD